MIDLVGRDRDIVFVIDIPCMCVRVTNGEIDIVKLSVSVPLIVALEDVPYEAVRESVADWLGVLRDIVTSGENEIVVESVSVWLMLVETCCVRDPDSLSVFVDVRG